MTDKLTRFISDRIDQDERTAREATAKPYPRWRIRLRRLVRLLRG